MINVTKSFLPDYNSYSAYIKKVWESGWLTNNGELTVELEEKLCNYLEVDNLILLNNGTIALQIAIKALQLKGEIITTPFSYVATTSSIVWENCTPVFADIDKETFCINPNEIESKITSKTCAILATHVYGVPCDVEQIEAIAKKHKLSVIYDAAHAFGVTFKGKSILNYGDVSTLSFHATKLFHTVEGGAIVTPNIELFNTMEYMRRFGHDGPYNFHGVGINGKISEIHAAMGLCVLPSMSTILELRKKISETYDSHLVPLGVIRPKISKETKYNYSYYPILLQNESVVLRVDKALKDNKILGRRYFYPSLNTLSYVKYDHMPVSEDIAKRVYCLPLYPDLTIPDVNRISKIVIDNL